MSNNNIEGENGMSIKGFFGLISFSTIIPLNIHTTIEEMARSDLVVATIGAMIDWWLVASGLLLWI